DRAGPRRGSFRNADLDSFRRETRAQARRAGPPRELFGQQQRQPRRERDCLGAHLCQKPHDKKLATTRQRPSVHLALQSAPRTWGNRPPASREMPLPAALRASAGRWQAGGSMDLGFETIGNATLIVHDRGPLLVTDPWLTGEPYFGSWTHSHEIPEHQLANIEACSFVWISHGHP